MLQEKLQEKTAFRHAVKNGIGMALDMELVHVLKSRNKQNMSFIWCPNFENVPCSTIVKSWRKTGLVVKGLLKNVDNNLLVKKDNVQEFEADNNISLLKGLQKLPGNTGPQT